MKKIFFLFMICAASVCHAFDDYDVSIVDSRTDKDKSVVILTLGKKEYRLLVKKTDLKEHPEQIAKWAESMADYEEYGKRRIDDAQ